MSTYILTSMFHKGFPIELSNQLKMIINKKNKFVFIASEFEKAHDKTDKYFTFFLNMFTSAGIHFNSAIVLDARMNIEEMHSEIATADVIWLAGGDTLTQHHYFIKHGLVTILKEYKGVVIGMSAGAINMAKTAICSLSCGHETQEIYQGLGLVEYSVEPHFTDDNISDELLNISQDYTLYGLCDESAIICKEDETIFIGDVYLINKGEVHKIS